MSSSADHSGDAGMQAFRNAMTLRTDSPVTLKHPPAGFSVTSIFVVVSSTVILVNVIPAGGLMMRRRGTLDLLVLTSSM